MCIRLQKPKVDSRSGEYCFPSRHIKILRNELVGFAYGQNVVNVPLVHSLG